MKITEIQRFCMHDGPGIRTTVFVKGCPLHCAWCHNPETQKTDTELLFFKNKCIFCQECSSCKMNAHSFTDTHNFSRELCISCGECANLCPTNALESIGKELSVNELFESVKRDVAFYRKDGGITVSGGEPFAQHEEVIELLKLCKSSGISTAVETCGVFPSSIIEEAVKYVDLFLWDVKDTDSDRHKKHTGASNKAVIDNLYKADSLGAKTLIRCIMIRGINMDEKHYSGIADIYGNLKNCIGVELIPYHSFGLSKSAALGQNTKANEDWIPDAEDMESVKEYLISHHVKII